VPVRIRRRAALAILFLALGVQAGCASGAQQLTDRDYVSVAVTEGGAAKALVNGTRIRINFSAAEGNDRDVGALVANAGCNSIAGTYRIEAGRLVFESGGMTAMGCDAERHAQDAWLDAFLASKPAVRLVNSDLTLDNGSTVVRLLDREVAEPDLHIVGPTWTVESTIDGDAVSSVGAGASATLTFKADGTVDVDAVCNRGSGTWKLDGAGVAISDLVLTKMACDGAGAALESAVVEVLRARALVARIEASSLTLSSGDRGLQLRGT